MIVPFANRPRRVPAAILALAFALGARSALPVGPAAAAPQQDGICSQAWIRQIRATRGLAAAQQAMTRPDPAVEARARSQPRRSNEPAGAERLLAGSEPNDFLFRNDSQQTLRRMHFTEAWEVTFGREEVVVAIIADGVDYLHPDLVGKAWRNLGEAPNNGLDDDGNGYVDDTRGWDFGESDNDPMLLTDGSLAAYPPTGTAMAGIIAADTNNREGIAGAAWNASYMALKTYYPIPRSGPPTGLGSQIDYVTEAVCYAANQGADVIVLSTMNVRRPDADGVIQDLMEAQEAVDHAHLQGVVVVGPAGECGPGAKVESGCPDPAAFGENRRPIIAGLDHVIAAASVDEQLTQRTTSSFGDWVDIAAQGEDVYSTWNASRGFPGQRTPYFKAKSQFPTPTDLAAAHVAAAVALMRSANPGLEPLRIEKALCDFADRTLIPGQSFSPPGDGSAPRNDRVGCGLVHAERSIENIPWKLSLTPDRIVHPVDVDDPEGSPALVLTSRNLNIGAISLDSDQDWLRFTRLDQPPGLPARMQITLDSEALRRAHGGGLAAGAEVRPTLQALVEVETFPGARAITTPQRLDVTYRFGNLSRVYLPLAARGVVVEGTLPQGIGAGSAR